MLDAHAWKIVDIFEIKFYKTPRFPNPEVQNKGVWSIKWCITEWLKNEVYSVDYNIWNPREALASSGFYVLKHFKGSLYSWKGVINLYTPRIRKSQWLICFMYIWVTSFLPYF